MPGTASSFFVLPRFPFLPVPFRLLLALALLPVFSAAAQDPDTLGRWNQSLAGTVNASQAAYSNWTQGGVNAIAVTAIVNGQATRQTLMWGQTHKLQLGYGVVKQDTLSLRKAEDMIRLETSLRYRGEGFFRRFRPTVAVAFRSQFAAGYNYDKNPFKDGRTPPVQVSAFMAPATITQAVGLTYEPVNWFRQRVGLGGKQTVVAVPTLRTLYNMSEDKLMRVEAGLESRTEVDADLAENIHLTSSLGLFAAFNRPDMPDVTWDNEIRMKVNSWLSTNLQVALLFDRDQSARAQIKEVLSLGVSIIMI